MWGFGMRNAMVSGYLAAKSIIEKKDYEILAKEYFKNKLKASVVNRYLWDNFSKGNYVYILNKIKKSKNILNLLKSYWNYNILQRIIFPFALAHCKKEYPKLDF